MIHTTRRLLSNSSLREGLDLPGLTSKLLLPPPTFWDNLMSAVQGLWSVATDPKQRKAFEDAIHQRIIRDDVLKNAYNGSTMTFTLFWNLQNPLWKTKSFTFDAKEFVRAVGPALTNLHDFLHCFQNQITQEYLDFKTQQESNLTAEPDDPDKSDESDGTILAAPGVSVPLVILRGFVPEDMQKYFAKFLQQKHPWREQAAADPDSVVACLSRMTTEEYMDGFTMSSKMGIPISNEAVYEEGSAKVGKVAILSARAMEIPLPGEKDKKTGDPWHDEVVPEELKDLKRGVAAQIDVLYEVTNRFQEKVSIERDDGEIDSKTERVEYTSLGVAVFEGWLDDGRGNENDFRWRIPLMREPFEFPMVAPVTRQVLPPSETKAAEPAQMQVNDSPTTKPQEESTDADGESEPEKTQSNDTSTTETAKETKGADNENKSKGST